MAIETDFSVAANGDIRYTGTTANHTVIEFHRWLSDLQDDAVASGDDLTDITDPTASERSTDNIIKLNSPYNIDDTAAQHLYDGSIEQDGGATYYRGLVVVGSVVTGTEIQIVQDNAILTSYWSTGLNTDPAANVLLRIMVKTRASSTTIDGERIRVFARELGDTFAEFSLTLGQGNSTAALFTSADINNETDGTTIDGWATIAHTDGYTLLDVNGDSTGEPYWIEYDKGSQTLNDLYEWSKRATQRGATETFYTTSIPGYLLRGVTHEFTYTGETGGPWTEGEVLTFGNGATAYLLAVDDQGSTGTMWVQLTTGAAPVNTNSITGGTSSATATINSTVTSYTAPQYVLGSSTGSNIIGSFGVGIEPADVGSSDKLTDLNGSLRVPPNNVVFTVDGLASGEDYVLVGPESGGTFDTAQLSADGAYTGGEATLTVVEAIPGDTPSSGTVRCWNGDTYARVTYTGWSGSDFTGCTGVPAMTSGDDIWISYIDTLAGSAAESFTGVYQTDRSLYIRVRDGGASPIKTFETTGTLGSAGGTTTAIRTSDE